MSSFGLAIATAVCFSLVGLSIPLARSRSETSLPMVLGFVAGILIGLAALYTKAMFLAAEAGAAIVAWTIFLPLMLGANLGGLWVQQAGFQRGRALIVVAMNAVTNKVVTIVGGTAALGEVLPEDGRLAAARIAGFVAVVAGTVLLSRFGADAVVEGGRLPWLEKRQTDAI